MYVRDTQQYKKQQRQVRKRRLFIRRVIFALALLFSVCFCVFALHAVAGEIYTKGVQAGLNKAELQEISAEPIAGKMQEIMKPEKASGEEGINNPVRNNESDTTQILNKEAPYLIVIDAGHGGADEGCGDEGIEEKDINLKLAHVLKEKLEEMNFAVQLTREEDTKLTLEERADTANDAGADAFISIHQNSCEDSSAEGLETWYCSANEGSERLAKLVQQYAVLYSKARDRGLMESNELYVIRESKMPSCLVETGFLTNHEERADLTDDTYLDRMAQGIADGIQLYFYPKVMYLTFDDGPSDENTNAILDTLKENDIKATFFVVGENVAKYPETAKRIVEEGHTIGIHCYNHAYDELYASTESFLEDFEKARQIVYEVTGEKVWCFRFPGGSVNSYNKKDYKEIIAEMTELGYVYYDWNASLEDAVKNPSPDKLIKNAEESTLGRKKIVMLAHDIIAATAECLDDLLDAFPEYEMRPLTQDVDPIQF